MLKLKLLVVLVVVFGIGACDDDPVKKSTLWCDGQCANGVCTPEGDGARCVCETGYTGLLCDECASGYERDANNVCVPVANDPCLQQPCLFGGECEAVDEENFICHCAEGYTGETCQQCAEGFVRSLEGTCVPEQIEDPCDPNPCFTGECIADGENFTCNCTEEGYTGEFCQSCAEGYVRLDDMSCVPNPCLNEHCSGHGVCQLNTATAEATCDCFEGYASVGLSCVDINECTANPCSSHATCENTDGGFVCECNVGYEGDGFVLCVDINECTANPCSSHATCENTDGGFVCECNVGYEGDGFVLCVDINECTANPCSSNATCENTDGGFVCECNSGYEGNGLSCSDINECASNPCLGHADCINTVGAYECHCQIGYTGLGCDICDTGFVNVGGACLANSCDPNPCLNNGTCVVNGGGVAECSCPAGYTGTYCQNCEAGYVQLVSGTCVLDACAGQTCSGHGTCSVDLNTGNASCTCDAGFTVSGLSCVDVDECLGNPCDANATCTNTVGSFTCACNAGFSGNGVVCSDVDECALNTDNCDANATCTNTVGSFTCACNPGFSGNGVVCSDINECALNTDNCDANATCTNTVGSFTCACNAGFSGNGVVCSDINECALNTDNCDANATCTNTVGSFTCTCNPGFSGNGVVCLDVDECALNTDNCDANATCTNTVGSFTCACNAGFSGNGVVCSDINECALNTDNCDANATCTNTVGSFTCACNPGFSGNGVVCSDINECALNTDNCDANATCTNTVGSFTCACNPGFSGNGVVCSDVDECLLNPCPMNATCANLPGSYTCTCLTGYTGSNCDVCDTANGYIWNGSACVLDACFGVTCSGHGTCSVQGGLPVCSCETGYTGTDCADCADNYRLMGGFCQPMFGRLAGGAIFEFAEANGELYGFGQNEVVVRYDEVEDTWREVWRPDIAWSSNDRADGIRNDFMAAASDGSTVYLLQKYFAMEEYKFITGSNRNIVRTFTPGATNPWGQLADIPPTGTQINPIRCNDLGVNASGDLLWAVCDDGSVYKYQFATDTWQAELVHDNTSLALNKIWVENENSIFVVGDAGFLKRWNGASWEDWRSANLDTDLYGVWGYSSSDLYVGGRGKLWHWNGTSWSLKFNQNSLYRYVRKIHGTADHSRVVALAIHDWNDNIGFTSHVWQSVSGGSWSGAADLYYWSLHCQGLGVSGDECFIGGSDGTIDNPTKMIRVSSLGQEKVLYLPYEPRGVSGHAHDDIFFVSNGAASHYDGQLYHSLPISSLGKSDVGFMATWADGSGGYWAVGPKGYVLYWNASSYDLSSLSTYVIDTADYSLSTDKVYAVHGSSPNNVWAAGSKGATFRWDGNTWTRFNLPHVDNRVTGILAISASEVYATGRNWSVSGPPYVYKWDGVSWSVIYTHTQNDYYTYNLLKDGIHICVPFKGGSQTDVVCSSDAGTSWNTYMSTSFGKSSGKIFGRKNNLFFLADNGLVLNYRSGQETVIHRETSNQDDDAGAGRLVDVWQDPASDFTVIIGVASKVLVHR